MHEQRTAFIFPCAAQQKDRRRAVFFHANKFQGQASGGGQATSMGLPVTGCTLKVAPSQRLRPVSMACWLRVFLR